jgi:hypothetical protein
MARGKLNGQNRPRTAPTRRGDVCHKACSGASLGAPPGGAKLAQNRRPRRSIAHLHGLLPARFPFFGSIRALHDAKGGIAGPGTGVQYPQNGVPDGARSFFQKPHLT